MAKKRKPRKARLDTIGSWRSAKDHLWDEMFDRLMNYRAQRGNCSVPTRYKDDPQLGYWAKTQRGKRGMMSEERKARLYRIGFQWSSRALWKKMYHKHWGDMVELLLEYKTQHGNYLVPMRYKDNPQLGRWVSAQRSKRYTMSEERKARLDSIGFRWNARCQYRDQSNSQEESHTRVGGAGIGRECNFGRSSCGTGKWCYQTRQH